MTHINPTLLLSILLSVAIVACKENGNDDPIEEQPETGYYVDAVNGNDELGNGSKENPFKTFDRALDTVKSGETLFLNSGDYGDIVVGRTPGKDYGFDSSEITIPYSRFTDWVTVKAATGETPHFNSLSIGTLNIPNSGSPARKISFSQQGNCDLYMSFEGITVDDGIEIYGSRYLKIKGCTINRLGELNGSTTIIDNKDGIDVINGRYITIEENEITHVAVAIGAASYDLTIKNNNIHHNSHDGIRIWGGVNWLIEGNKIHDIDDGVDDGSGYDWNRHVDGIQIWPMFDDVKNLTVRGNIFYHIESMGIMVQTETNAENWTFENNIFGPVGGLLFHLGTDVYKSCIFRHNTTVYAPNDEWKSIYRTLNGQNYKFALWTGEDSVNAIYRFYNNIFTTDTEVPAEYGVNSNNIYYDYNANNAASPYEAIPGNIADYIASGKIPGTLTANSEAINNGTNGFALECPLDYTGKTRDKQPDIGALEK